MGGSDALGSIIDRTNAMFTRLVNERAAGKVSVNFIQGEQLGNDVQVIEQMMRGGVHVYGDVVDWYANWVKDLSVLAWGFTFRDFDHMQKFLDSDLFKPYAEELRTKHSVRILASAPTQPRILFATKPVKSPDELKELKMRVPDIRAYLLLWQTLGTRPSRVAWGEVFLGLKTGVIDAAEGPVLSAFAAKFHQAAPTVMRTDHVIAGQMISINEAAFQKLSPEMQKIVTEAAREAIAWSAKQSKAEIDDIYGTMRKEGATILDVDKEPFAKAARAGVEQMEKDGVWAQGLFQKIQNIR
ncbi:MAG: TRAP transporter substrate-binding protein [Hyphomicrobiaceae bacterium]|nr:TRAP transporter substrate-binding protein [Hyphomicrobiaceae bacterium]